MSVEPATLPLTPLRVVGITSTDEVMGRLLLTRDEVSELLSVPTNTVDYLHRVRKLSAVRVGKTNLWKPAAVREFVEGLTPVKDG